MGALSGISDKMGQHRRVIINVFLATVGILLIVLMVKFSGVSLKMIIDNIRNTKYYYLVAITVTTFCIVGLTSCKWKIILNNLIEIKRVAKGYFLYYSAIGLVSNNIVPQIGNYGLKTVSMKLRYNVPVDKAVLSIFIEQLFDLLTLILIIIPSLLFFLKILSLEASLAFIIISFLLLLGLLIYNYSMIFGIIVQGHKFLYKIASRFFLFKKNHGDDFVISDKLKPFSKTTAIELFFYSCLKQICIVLRIYIVMLALEINVPFFPILLGASLVQALILVTFIPGSLGTLEAGWFSILALLGVNKVEIGVFIVVVRVLAESSLIFVTFLSYLYYMFNKILPKPELAKTN